MDTSLPTPEEALLEGGQPIRQASVPWGGASDGTPSGPACPGYRGSLLQPRGPEPARSGDVCDVHPPVHGPRTDAAHAPPPPLRAGLPPTMSTPRLWWCCRQRCWRRQACSPAGSLQVHVAPACCPAPLPVSSLLTAQPTSLCHRAASRNLTCACQPYHPSCGPSLCILPPLLSLAHNAGTNA